MRNNYCRRLTTVVWFLPQATLLNGYRLFTRSTYSSLKLVHTNGFKYVPRNFHLNAKLRKSRIVISRNMGQLINHVITSETSLTWLFGLKWVKPLKFQLQPPINFELFFFIWFSFCFYKLKGEWSFFSIVIRYSLFDVFRWNFVGKFRFGFKAIIKSLSEERSRFTLISNFKFL